MNYQIMKEACNLNKHDIIQVQKSIPNFHGMILGRMDDIVNELLDMNYDYDEVWKEQIDHFYVDQLSNRDITEAIKTAEERRKYLEMSTERIISIKYNIAKLESELKQCERMSKFLIQVQLGIKNIIEEQKFRNGELT